MMHDAFQPLAITCALQEVVECSCPSAPACNQDVDCIWACNSAIVHAWCAFHAMIAWATRWLEEQLSQAQQSGERVIAAAHHPLHSCAARRPHLAWNHGDIAAKLIGCSAVVLVLAGHDHEGGYGFHSGKHWLTVPALLEGGCVSPSLPMLLLVWSVCVMKWGEGRKDSVDLGMVLHAPCIADCLSVEARGVCRRIERLGGSLDVHAHV